MEAKNLRIGNLVGIKKTALHADGCNIENAYFEIEELKKDVVQFKGFHAGEYYKDLEPIKLTDGMLKLYGFEVEYTNGGFLRWQRGSFKLLDRRLPHPMTDIHREYVLHLHELQNLFFAITGTELELTHEPSTCG
ncbi:hypothetical protein [Winogradskyella pulchriflava]|uniref:Uncharacterized protein n=1 Tax=Winogradskyella pulchriflava TaxID=1110688 RepID=A0ABV6QF36_9FLAO